MSSESWASREISRAALARAWSGQRAVVFGSDRWQNLHVIWGVGSWHSCNIATFARTNGTVITLAT